MEHDIDTGQVDRAMWQYGRKIRKQSQARAKEARRHSQLAGPRDRPCLFGMYIGARVIVERGRGRCECELYSLWKN